VPAWARAVSRGPGRHHLSRIEVGVIVLVVAVVAAVSAWLALKLFP